MKIHALNESGVGFTVNGVIGTTRCGVGGRIIWRDERRQLLTSHNYLMPLVKLGRVQAGRAFLEAKHVPAEEPTCRNCLRLYRHEPPPPR